MGGGIMSALSFNKLLCDTVRNNADTKIPTNLQNITATESVTSIAFLAGPEGGWTEEEIGFLIQQGFQTVTLGPRLLKADSASLVILSLLQHRWGDL